MHLIFIFLRFRDNVCHYNLVINGYSQVFVTHLSVFEVCKFFVDKHVCMQLIYTWICGFTYYAC